MAKAQTVPHVENVLHPNVVSWTQIIVLATAVITFLTALITAATGALRLTGTSVFASPGFWTVYGGFLVVVFAGVIDFVLLVWLRGRLGARDWRLTRAPDGFHLLAYVVWLALAVPYFFWLGGLASQSEYPGPMMLVCILAVFALPAGGYPIGLGACEVDKTLNPWAYHQDD